MLIGTQMIVKGHDFPKVTLVGILAADLSLNDSDYRCGERTFQLLTQAAGRAGRGEREGDAVIQTYRPDHYSVIRAAQQDYEAFYEEEILYRELAGYPPAEHMLSIMITAKDDEAGSSLANDIAAYVKGLQEASEVCDKVKIIGPAKARIGKINDIYRFVFYVKHPAYELLVETKDCLEAYLHVMDTRRLNIQFDFNPINGL